MGHDARSMTCVGFRTVLARAAEWAATGKVTLPVPADFPTPEKVSVVKPGLAWSEAKGTSLSLVKNGQVLWTLNYSSAEAKPFFHPLRTPAGTDLTWLRPPDHVWHRALWFSWKLINGLNYWEEDPATGKSEGVNEPAGFSIARSDDGSARIILDIRYHPPGKDPLVTEKRTLQVHPPRPDGSYCIDWHQVFTAGPQEVVFDRTKPLEHGGVSWGGYAGLSYRAAPTLRQYTVIDSNGWRSPEKFSGYGKTANWMDFSATDNGRPVGLAILDHPASARHPAPWYVIADGSFAYFSPAILFHDSLKLAPGEKLKLFYRVIVHDGAGQRERLDAEYAEFSKVRPPAE
jgi:hypothetical protein